MSKEYWWWPPDASLMKNGKVMCPKCMKHLAILDRQWGVKQCKFCNEKQSKNYVPSHGFSAEEKIRSRVRMPDGTILTGRAGMAERDRRLKNQNSGRITI